MPAFCIHYFPLGAGKAGVVIIEKQEYLFKAHFIEAIEIKFVVQIIAIGAFRWKLGGA